MLLSEATELYIRHIKNIDRAPETIKGYTIELNLLGRFLYKKYNGPVYIEEITLHDLEDYMQSLKEKGHAATSRNRVVYIIRSFYNLCYKKEFVSKNLGIKLEAVSAPEKERVYLSADEMEQLISAIKPPIIKLIITTLYYTGMRISECLNLLVEDVDFNDNLITVRNTKNKRDRQIPIHRDLQPLLYNYYTNWRKGGANPHLFAYNRARKISPDRVNRVLRETTQRLNWSKHVTCHIIRHSFASNLVAKNVNIVNIQKLLGHTNLSTTSIYTHTNINELKKAVNTI
jgi:site-specific recombinase XerD